MNLVLSYYAVWSRSGTDVDNLSQFYGDTVIFYGSAVPRPKIMDEKRKFSVRWPIRHYAVRTRTMYAQCTDTCSVTGVVEWDVSSVERGFRSVGTANFVLKITPDDSQNGGVILSENGSVLSSHMGTLASSPQASVSPPANQLVPIATPNGPAILSTEQQAASTTTAYADGRQARTEYEKWFTALPDGSFRDGAVFWATNRSAKPQPSCVQPGTTADWQAGCAAGRVRLATSDIRRKADRDYWLGWNSI